MPLSLIEGSTENATLVTELLVNLRASPDQLALPLAFAGGAVLASVADTLMPEAFVKGRPFNSFATAAGFFVSFVLAGA